MYQVVMTAPTLTQEVKFDPNIVEDTIGEYLHPGHLRLAQSTVSFETHSHRR